MNVHRRNAIASMLSICGATFFRPAFGQDCSVGTIKEQQKICLAALIEKRNMLITAKNANDSVLDMALGLIQPTVEVGEVVVALIRDCAVAKNPVPCGMAILDIPDAIENIGTILTIVDSIKKRLREASAFRGAAKRGWHEQGGEDAMRKLYDCGFLDCFNVNVALDKYGDELKAMIERNQVKIDQFEKDLLELKSNLTRCAANQDDCAGLKEFTAPTLEGSQAPPEVVLP